MDKIILNNKGSYTFFEVDTEEYRVYSWLDSSYLRIDNPLYVSVNPKNGGHRVLDSAGVSHYIPATWKHLSWKAKDGAPHFVK